MGQTLSLENGGLAQGRNGKGEKHGKSQSSNEMKEGSADGDTDDSKRRRRENRENRENDWESEEDDQYDETGDQSEAVTADDMIFLTKNVPPPLSPSPSSSSSSTSPTPSHTTSVSLNFLIEEEIGAKLVLQNEPSLLASLEKNQNSFLFAEGSYSSLNDSFIGDEVINFEKEGRENDGDDDDEEGKEPADFSGASMLGFINDEITDPMKTIGTISNVNITLNDETTIHDSVLESCANEAITNCTNYHPSWNGDLDTTVDDDDDECGTTCGVDAISNFTSHHPSLMDDLEGEYDDSSVTTCGDDAISNFTSHHPSLADDLDLEEEVEEDDQGGGGDHSCGGNDPTTCAMTGAITDDLENGGGVTTRGAVNALSNCTSYHPSLVDVDLDDDVGVTTCGGENALYNCTSHHPGSVMTDDDIDDLDGLITVGEVVVTEHDDEKGISDEEETTLNDDAVLNYTSRYNVTSGSLITEYRDEEDGIKEERDNAPAAAAVGEEEGEEDDEDDGTTEDVGEPVMSEIVEVDSLIFRTEETLGVETDDIVTTIISTPRTECSREVDMDGFVDTLSLRFTEVSEIEREDREREDDIGEGKKEEIQKGEGKNEKERKERELFEAKEGQGQDLGFPQIPRIPRKKDEKGENKKGERGGGIKEKRKKEEKGMGGGGVGLGKDNARANEGEQQREQERERSEERRRRLATLSSIDFFFPLSLEDCQIGIERPLKTSRISTERRKNWHQEGGPSRDLRRGRKCDEQDKREKSEGGKEEKEDLEIPAQKRSPPPKEVVASESSKEERGGGKGEKKEKGEKGEKGEKAEKRERKQRRGSSIRTQEAKGFRRLKQRRNSSGRVDYYSLRGAKTQIDKDVEGDLSLTSTWSTVEKKQRSPPERGERRKRRRSLGGRAEDEERGERGEKVSPDITAARLSRKGKGEKAELTFSSPQENKRHRKHYRNHKTTTSPLHLTTTAAEHKQHQTQQSPNKYQQQQLLQLQLQQQQNNHRSSSSKRRKSLNITSFFGLEEETSPHPLRPLPTLSFDGGQLRQTPSSPLKQQQKRKTLKPLKEEKLRSIIIPKEKETDDEEEEGEERENKGPLEKREKGGREKEEEGEKEEDDAYDESGDSELTKTVDNDIISDLFERSKWERDSDDEFSPTFSPPLSPSFSPTFSLTYSPYEEERKEERDRRRGDRRRRFSDGYEGHMKSPLSPSKPRRPWEWLKDRMKKRPERTEGEEEVLRLDDSDFRLESSSPHALFNQLSEEIMFLIFAYLDLKSFGRCFRVCRLWRNLCQNRRLQRCILSRNGCHFNSKQLFVEGDRISLLSFMRSKYDAKKTFENGGRNRVVLSRPLQLHKELISCVCVVSPSTGLVVNPKPFAASKDGRIFALDGSNKKRSSALFSFKGHRSSIQEMQVLARHSRLITGSNDVKIWNFDSILEREEEAIGGSPEEKGQHVQSDPEPVQTLSIPGAVFCLQADQTKLIVSSLHPGNYRKGIIKSYDLETTQEIQNIRMFPKHRTDGAVRSFHFSDNLFAGSTQRGCLIFDLRAGSHRSETYLKGDNVVTQVSLSGNKVAIGDFGNTIRLYDLRKTASSLFEYSLSYEQSDVYVRGMRLDGPLLYSVHNSTAYQNSKGSRLMVWSVESRECLFSITRKEGIKSKVNAFDFVTGSSPTIFTAHGERGCSPDSNCVMSWHFPSRSSNLFNLF